MQWQRLTSNRNSKLLISQAAKDSIQIYSPSHVDKMLLRFSNAGEVPPARLPTEVVCDPFSIHKILHFLAVDKSMGGQAGDMWPTFLVASFNEFRDMSLATMLITLVALRACNLPAIRHRVLGRSGRRHSCTFGSRGSFKDTLGHNMRYKPKLFEK